MELAGGFEMSEVTDILAQAKLFANSKDQAATAARNLIDKLTRPVEGIPSTCAD